MQVPSKSHMVRGPMVSLAERNLIRSKRLGQPAGQDVARAMGLVPLSKIELGVPDPRSAGWSGKAPLWFYILREAEIRQTGRLLGPVDGGLVAEVILGILNCDKNSYLHAKTPFHPAHRSHRPAPSPWATSRPSRRAG